MTSRLECHREVYSFIFILPAVLPDVDGKLPRREHLSKSNEFLAILLATLLDDAKREVHLYLALYK